MFMPQIRHTRLLWLLGLLLTTQAALLAWLGQPLLCGCGYIKIWEGTVFSVGNSQHLSDWYTFSHIIHGFIFYFVVQFLFPRLPFAPRLLLATGLEVGWEILENTPLVIDLYRQQALAQGYAGDSILNSLSDTLVMVGGFLLAWRLPVALTVALALGMELFVGYMIRDNLVLNIVNFIYPFEFLYYWQNGPM